MIMLKFNLKRDKTFNINRQAYPDGCRRGFMKKKWICGVSALFLILALPFFSRIVIVDLVGLFSNIGVTREMAVDLLTDTICSISCPSCSTRITVGSVCSPCCSCC